MSPAKAHGYLLCKCSFDAVFCKPNAPILCIVENCLILALNPCRPRSGRGFSAFSVDKPVDNVDNFVVGKLEIWWFLENYVNCYSVDILSR